MLLRPFSIVRSLLRMLGRAFLRQAEQFWPDDILKPQVTHMGASGNLAKIRWVSR